MSISYQLSHNNAPPSLQLTVHFSHGSYVVVRVLKADKTVALCLPCALVPHHLRFQEGWVAAECTRQDVIVHLIAKVTTEDPEIIWKRK